MSIILAIIFVGLLGLLIYTLKDSFIRPANFPPGPPFPPFIGNTIQLRKLARQYGGQHKVFEEWSKQYRSDILGLKLGRELVVVVHGNALVRDVQLREVFEGRPDTFFLRLRTMGTRKGVTCTDGMLWYEHRMFVMRQMRHVGYGRTPMERHIERESYDLIEYIKTANEKPIWPGSFLAPSVLNVLWCLTAGKCIKRDDPRLIKLLTLLERRSKVFDLCGGWLTQFSWLRWIAPEKTGYNLVLQMNQELHAFFMETINEHKSQRKNRSTENEEDMDNDFIYAYLKEMYKRSEDGSASENTFNETQLIMTILDLFIAGSQTTSNTIDLALMTLALYPEFQQILYDEICTALSNKNDESVLQLSAHTEFPQTNAFLLEVQRYYTIVPITGPRRALWDTELGGYKIPKNTTILIGIHSVMWDEAHWKDPERFRPSRFLAENSGAENSGAENSGTDNQRKVLKDEFFMPFGLGRRRCLGDALARACIFSFVIQIVKNFHISLCGDQLHAEQMMKLLPGITMSPKPYKVQFSQR